MIDGYAFVSDLPSIRQWIHLVGFVGVRFVRDHHRAVRRVALAVDGTVAELAPRLAQHFVRAELRHFGYDELDEAVAWAAGPNGQRPAPVSTGTQPRSRDT
jgi:hypothetical protein